MKDEIHTCAKNALKGGVMDVEIYDADVIEAFGSRRKSSIECYLDLPIGNLIALGPREFHTTGDSWRDAAQKLHCQRWDEDRDDIVRYFTSDLLNKSFPAKGSCGELRIGFTGGAIYCQLGNHRAVAAKAWLASKYGEEAVFKKVKCYYQNVCPPLKQLMSTCIEEGSTLKYAFTSSECEYMMNHGASVLIMVERTPSSFDIYTLNTKLEILQLVAPSRNLICRLLKLDLRSKCSRLKFKEVPTKLIEIMLDEKTLEFFQLNAVKKASNPGDA